MQHYTLAGLVMFLILSACRSKPALDFGSGLDVPYVQTAPAVVTKMLQMAQVRKNDVVVDLGCGDGRIVIAAVTQFGARGIGYDIDPDRITEARENARRAGVESRAQFVQRNFFEAPIGQATVVTVYLLPPVMERIKPRLRSELHPGTRIVSHSFPLRDWPPEQVVHFEGRTLYLFTVPD